MKFVFLFILLFSLSADAWLTPVVSGSSGSGTVTSVAATTPSFMSVAGSPITAAGSLDFSLASTSAHYTLIGPTSGSGAPTQRLLVGSDLPVLIGDSGSGGTRTPAFPGGFAQAQYGGLTQAFNDIFSGSATGPKFTSTVNGVILTGGAGINYFPGNSAGTIATGGQYQ